MLRNRDVFARDPLQTTIPNDGYAQVIEPRTPQEWEVLRWELSTFVCEGKYRSGLDRILSTYLRHLGEPAQPAVWISGFYGSGKSHLARVLEMLWRDVEFPGGATARGLAHLPDEIRAHFHELSVASRRAGGLWSAAGKIGAAGGDSTRLAILGVVFRSAGLPERSPLARFELWLRKNRYYDAVRAGVEAAGREFRRELRELYVSPLLARALLEAYPGLAGSEAETHELLRTNFPSVEDISDDELVNAIEDVLDYKSETPGRRPYTLILLDEVQQYVGGNTRAAEQLQFAEEACSTRFGSQLLFVGTGQSALQSTPQLARLEGRFTVRIELADTDVERVVRQVVLEKAPARVPDVTRVLEQCSGEIDRHLAGSRIAPSAADAAVLAADYPLLPARRRFWERALRAIDRAGSEGQLRSQLRLVHEAARQVAERPLGWVVPGDILYQQQQAAMLRTGVLPRELDELIARQNDGTQEGDLRARLCALIFLIGQLPRDPGADAGVRATPEALADLLVEDLTAGSAALRQRIPALLAGMLDDGSLMLVGPEYRLQTREGAEWTADYRTRYSKIFGDDARIAGDRTREIHVACETALRNLTILHGDSRTPRKIELQFGPDEPKTDSGAVPVWIRDEWSVSEKGVRDDAQAAGAEGPVVYVFLPRRGADELKAALAGHAAASETLARPEPATHEGREARQGMATQNEAHRAAIDTHLRAILADARVYQGGGSEVTAEAFPGAVRTAGEAALERLFPLFKLADDPKWNLVKNRVREGSGDPLSALAYAGDVEKHPACRHLLDFLADGGKKGIEVRRRFTGPPYGWPQDAVDGALLALLGTGHLRALQQGTPVSLQQVDQTRISQTEFQAEARTVTATQRIAVRKLLGAAGTSFRQGDEALALPYYIADLLALAQAAGGEPPLPAVPHTAHLDVLRTRSGNDLVLGVYEAREQLEQEREAWAEAKRKAAARRLEWGTLERLLRHADGLPAHAEVEPDVAAVREQRSRLADPDPVPDLCRRVADALRQAVTAAREAHLAAYDEQMGALLESPEWELLEPPRQQEIRDRHGLGALTELRVGTTGELLATLDAAPLADWENRTAALAERIDRARLAAARALEPQAVRLQLPGATLHTEAEADAYLAQLRAAILVEIAAGRPVVV